MNNRNGFFQVDTERMNAEAKRPMDWQDRVVVAGCVITILACILLMLS
jgi:hypothetical protein